MSNYTPTERDLIAMWVEAFVVNPADEEWIAHARTALPQATTALRAVLDLHQADPDEDVCNECWHLWPCGTVKTLTKALEGDE